MKMMKAKRIKENVVLLFLILSCSCNSSQSVLEDLDELVKDMEENYTEYTVEEWENCIENYTKIEEALLQYEYSDEDLKKIGKLKGKYVGYLTKYTIQGVKRQIEDISKEMEGGIEGLMEVFNSETNQ